MIALDRRRQELEAELTTVSSPEALRLHPGMADVYRRKVRELEHRAFNLARIQRH
jgi:hypothetical protein